MSETPTIYWFINKKLGYPIEKHVYYTQDRYLNTVFRIPGPKGSTKDDNTPKKVAIYQHGFIDCCIGIVFDEENSLGL